MGGLLQMLHSYLSSTKEEDIIKDIKELKEILKTQNQDKTMNENEVMEYLILTKE